MPLTTRTNGSSGSNVITASWFNDFKTLLTGGMQDQEVTIKNNVVAQAISAGPTVAPSGTIAAGTSLGIGNYQYQYTWVSPDGESLPSPASTTVTTTTGNQNVSVSAVAVGPTGTTARKLYRTKLGNTTPFLLVTTLNDNTTTTFSDTVADGSLGAAAPVHPSFGGSFVMKDNSGTTQGQSYSDGTLALNGSLLLNQSPTVINGSTAGQLRMSYPAWGPGLKIAVMQFAGFNNSGAAGFNFPSKLAFAIGMVTQIGSMTATLYANGVAQNVHALATLGGSAAGTDAYPLNSLHADTIFFTDVASIDSIQVSNTGGAAINGTMIIIGV